MNTTNLNTRLIGGLLVLGVALAGCGSDDDSGIEPDVAATTAALTPTTDPPTPSDPPETTAPPETATPPTTAAPENDPIVDPALDYAEGLIDSFYSYDAEALATVLDEVEGTAFVTFYQGWAEGAHYEVLERKPCVHADDDVTCAITVKDDFMGALGIDFNVTDTFHIRLDAEGEPIEIFTTSNDPDETGDAFEWVFANKPELFVTDCLDFFDGGPTPGACAEQVVAAFREYAALPADGAA